MSLFRSFSFSQTEDIKVKDYSITIKSNVLDDERKLMIQHIYNTSEPKDSLIDKTPVILVLDPNVLYNYISAIISFLEYSQEYPSFILIGIPNNNRFEEIGFKVDNKFAKFINNEVMPLIKENFENHGSIHAIGHSATADFILYDMIQNLSSACLLSCKVYKPEDYSFLFKSKTSYYCYSGEEDFRLKYLHGIDSLKNTNKIEYANILITKSFVNRSHDDVPLDGVEDFFKNQFKQYKNLTTEEVMRVMDSRDKVMALDNVIKYKNKKLNINFSPSLYDVMSFSNLIDSTEFEKFFINLLNIKGSDITQLFVLSELGSYYEEKKEYKQALNTYNKMYSLIEYNPQMKPQVDNFVSNVKLLMK